MKTSHPRSRGWRRLIDAALLALIELLDVDGDHMWSIGRRLLNRLGFYWVHHRTALTVWRRGKYLYLLDAPSMHRWCHKLNWMSGEEIGPEITLKPTQIPARYDNIHTTLGAGPGRPISIGLRLLISYFFEPQAAPEANPDFVEGHLKGGPQLCEATIKRVARAPLERIVGNFSPLDISLHWAEEPITTALREDMNKTLKNIALRVTSITIDEVFLPEELETMVIANQELLRQSIARYTPVELAQIAVSKMSQGWATHPPVAGVNVQPVVTLGLSEERRTTIDMPPLPIEPESSTPPPPPPSEPLEQSRRRPRYK